VIQITPQMRVLVGVAPADFRCGIDGLAQRCRTVLAADPLKEVLGYPLVRNFRRQLQGAQ